MPELPLYSRASDIKTLTLGDGCEGGWLLKHLYAGELPDATWFALGTALHEGFEACIVNDLDLNGLQGEVHLNLQIAIAESDENGMLESVARKAKRTKASMFEDGERLAIKWFNSVHPDGSNRDSKFEEYDWPPRVEHEIKLTPKWAPKNDPDAVALDLSLRLFTTVDAIFSGGKFGEEVYICDWKTGSSRSAHYSQLQVYMYGGRKEGWVPDDQLQSVGRFWHVEHEKDQPVWDYVGDTVIDEWVSRTYRNKLRLIESEMPVFDPSFLCNYCTAKSVCPVKGNGSFSEIRNRMAATTVITEPHRDKED